MGGEDRGLGRELQVALRAARAAAAAILAQRGRASVSIKPDGSPVTSADLAADAAIRAEIAAAFPGDAVLTEEGDDDRARLAAPRCWIGDPLDGTSYFVAGSDDFDTFLALAIDGTPAVAVTLQPATGLLLAAVAGGGAWVQAGDGERRPLALAPRRPCRVATKAWLGAPGNLDRVAAAAQAVQGEVLQPAFSLCPRCFHGPAARVDAVVGWSAVGEPLSWEWDIAPLDLIVREAGGVVTDLAGDRLRFNQPEPRFVRGLVVAADPVVHQRLLDALARP
jgi:myo-inositol-1(or 4)-monophosphatase